MTAMQSAPAKDISGGGGLDLSSISAALQQLLVAVQSLVTSIGGVSGGGDKGTPTQAAMSAAQIGQFTAPTQTAGASSKLDDKTLLGPNVIDAKSRDNVQITSSGKVIFQRSQPEDRTKAAAVLQKLMGSTSKFQDASVAQAAGYDFNKFPMEAGNLVHAIKGGQNLNLEDPGMLLYRKGADGSLKLIGVALGSNNAAPDLGMGTWHVHGTTNINMMKHLWFTPNDLDTAFNEATPPTSKI